MPITRTLLVLAVLLLPLASGCGSGQHPGTDSLGQASQQLQGTWRLKNFTPQTPLEAPLQGLLTAQFGTLLVSFDGGQFTATGPGITVQGRYEMSSAANGLFSLTIYDSVGVAYHVSAQFEGAIVHFQSLDNPWRGTGTLERNPG